MGAFIIFEKGYWLKFEIARVTGDREPAAVVLSVYLFHAARRRTARDWSLRQCARRSGQGLTVQAPQSER